MFKYFSKKFFGDEEEIDKWLNGFEEERNKRPTANYNFKIVGYVTCGKNTSGVLITVEVWELKK